MELAPRALSHEQERQLSDGGRSVSSQIAVDEHLRGAIKFDEGGRVLVNCLNGTLRVTEDDATLLPHDKEQLFTGYVNAEYHGIWTPEMTPRFNGGEGEIGAGAGELGYRAEARCKRAITFESLRLLRAHAG